MDDGQSTLFLDPVDVITYARGVELLAMDVLHRGPLVDMLQLDACFQTTVPTLLGLPPLPNNSAEGYVLRPLHSVTLPRGRVMLKHKNPKFAENICEKPARVGVASELAEEEESTFLRMLQYINENRFNAVMSKMTDEQKANHKGVVGLTVKDAMEDIVKDMGDLITPRCKGLFHKKLMQYGLVFWDENPVLHFAPVST